MKICPRFFHVRALIPLFAILCQDSCRIDDGVYFRHYFPVIDWPSRVRIKLLDLESARQEARKGGAGILYLLEPRLFLQDHGRVDWALHNCVRQEIPRPHVLKDAMEVPHPRDVSGGVIPLEYAS